MAEQYVMVSQKALEDYARRMLEGAGVQPDKADLVARSLVEANLRGVDSHGVQLLNFYIEHMVQRCMALDVEGHVVSESGGCMLYSGDNGIGQIVSNAACDHAIRLAKEHGVAVVTVRDSNHFGAAAFWAQKIARADLIGMAMCNATPLVPPWQGKEPRFGTNPICMALPGAAETSWLLDMATTTVAMGKIFKAQFSNEPVIPQGWAYDSDGAPTTETAAAIKGMPMPLGGYKGSGLAFMVEILVAVLSGGAMSTEVGGIRIRTRPMRCGQVFLAIDVSRFMPVEEFNARMEQLVGMVKSTPPAPGYEEVLVAGEPEWRNARKRRQEGIPLSRGVWKELAKTAAAVNVDPPEVE
ncbi:MAG TPA: Ldh family oxidoreductase [Bryobacteraceae bacterium]|nr:Ldh family oxidoreductase [Bryobacteraceae bacterium]